MSAPDQPQLHIRAAGPADAGVLARLNEHVHALHVRAEPERYRATELEALEQRYAAVLAESGWSFSIAELDGEALGYVALREMVVEETAMSQRYAYLLVDELAVAPSARRRGVGRALMVAATERAQQLGLARVELHVRAHNHGALAFYEALGFEPLGWRLGLALDGP